MALTGAEAHELAALAVVPWPASRLLAIDLPRRGAADGRRAGSGADGSDGPGGLFGGPVGPDRALASRPGAVLRRRRPRRCRGLPADPRDLDARAGALRPRLGLGPDAGQGHPRWRLVPDRQPRPDRRRGRARRRRRHAPDHELLRRAAGQESRRPRVPRRRRVAGAGQPPGLRRPRRVRVDTARPTSRWLPSGRRSTASPGRAGSPRWPGRSPRAGRIAPAPSRPPTSWTSSTARRRRWPMAAARSRSTSTFTPPPLMPWAEGALDG